MKKTFLLFIVFVILAPSSVFAQCPPGQVIISYTGTGQPVCGPFSCADPGDVNTALGCIPTDPAELVKWILGWSIAMGGGIAFLLSLWGGVTVILAGGNPEKINEGKEIITSAISGLLFIIFSIFLLRLIGVNILGIF